VRQRILSRSKNVEVTEGYGFEPIHMMKAPAVPLARVLATAYGENGAAGRPSCFGIAGFWPYTDDEEAYTTRGSSWSRAADSTFSVPVTLEALLASGIFDRPRNRGKGCLVENDLATSDRAMDAARSSVCHPR